MIILKQEGGRIKIYNIINVDRGWKFSKGSFYVPLVYGIQVELKEVKGIANTANNGSEVIDCFLVYILYIDRIMHH